MDAQVIPTGYWLHAILAQASSWFSIPSMVGFLGIVAALGTGYVAYRKAKPEATAIIVDAAKDIVILQKGELERLQTSLETAHKRIVELEKENASCIKQIKEDEKRIRELERRLDEIDQNRN